MWASRRRTRPSSPPRPVGSGSTRSATPTGARTTSERGASKGKQGPRAGGRAGAGRAGGRARRGAGGHESRLREPVEELDLRGVELLAGGLDVEPLGAVDLGKLGGLSRPWRPLHLEGVGDDGAHVQFALAVEAPDLLAVL